VSVPLRKDDPCYWMLEEGLKDPSKRTRVTVYQDGCYICEDPEFSLMGLPLCYSCTVCGGHVPADDSVCSDCGHDAQDNCGPVPDGYDPVAELGLKEDTK
jgi:hypothetical protein